MRMRELRSALQRKRPLRRIEPARAVDTRVGGAWDALARLPSILRALKTQGEMQ
jgi:hypothetical protein